MVAPTHPKAKQKHWLCGSGQPSHPASHPSIQHSVLCMFGGLPSYYNQADRGKLKEVCHHQDGHIYMSICLREKVKKIMCRGQEWRPWQVWGWSCGVVEKAVTRSTSIPYGHPFKFRLFHV